MDKHLMNFKLAALNFERSLPNSREQVINFLDQYKPETESADNKNFYIYITLSYPQKITAKFYVVESVLGGWNIHPEYVRFYKWGIPYKTVGLSMHNSRAKNPTDEYKLATAPILRFLHKIYETRS